MTIGLAIYDPENDAGIYDVARGADQLMYVNKKIRKGKQRQAVGKEDQ